MEVGYGKVGSGSRSSCTFIRRSWQWGVDELGVNGTGLSVGLVKTAEERKYLEGRRQFVYARKPGDPRKSRYHQLVLTFTDVNHELVQRVEEEEHFLTGGVRVKVWQFDYPDIGQPTPFADAARLRPATPGASTCSVWYTPYRWLSSDAGEQPKLYVNAVLQTSGITWDYTEGAVTFTTPKTSTDIIRAYYVWHPKCTIAEPAQKSPRTGQRYREPRYNLVVTLDEL
jgi:hypothetical protein